MGTCDGVFLGIDCLLSLTTGSKLLILSFVTLDGLESSVGMLLIVLEVVLVG